MMHSIKIVALLLVLSWCCSPAAAAEPPTNWPQWTGADGRFTIAGPKEPMVERIADMKQLWLSEFHGLGVAKFGGRSVKAIDSLPEESQFIGGWTSPIAAEGMIFCAFYKPGGKPGPKNGKAFGSPGKVMSPAMQFLSADDGVVAIDAETGKTRWLTMNPQEGINYLPDKRQGWAVSPVWIDGVVISLGTSGIVSGYDANNGKRLWKLELPNCHEHLAEMLKQHEAQNKYIGRIEKQASLIDSGGRAIVPDQHGGLAAIDPKTGKLLWHLKPTGKNREENRYVGTYSTPASWRHAGKHYVVCQNNVGTLRLIDTEKGTLVWTLDGLGPNLATVQILQEDVVLVNTRVSSPADKDYGLYGGVILSVEKPQVAWSFPDEPKYRHNWVLDRGAEQRFLDLGKSSLVWLRQYKRDMETPPMPQPMRRIGIEPRTGKVLSDDPLTESKTYPMMEQSYPIRIGDRVLAVRDPAHSPKECGLELFKITEDGRLQSLDCDPLWPGKQHVHAGGYEVAWLRTAYNGRLYVRTYDGAIACYDLRRP